MAPDRQLTYVDAGEAGNARRSFDVNYYAANRRVADITDPLRRLAEKFSLDIRTMDRLMELTTEKGFGHLSAGIDRHDRAAVEAAFVEHLDHLDGLLDGRDWLVSDERCLADIAVAAQLDEVVRTSSFSREIEYRARLSAWLERNR